MIDSFNKIILVLKIRAYFQDFFAFASQRGLFRKREHDDKNVFVVPVFETKEGTPVPRQKAELLKLVDAGDVRPFYVQLCLKCQVVHKTIYIENKKN